MKRVVISVLVIGIISICGSVEAPPKRAMIDVHHSMEGVKPEVNMVAITKVLAGFTFDIKDEPLTEGLLQTYNVVMLVQPYENLEDAEIDALTEYVRKGGGLIICGEHDVGWNDSSRSTYNKLGKTFGVIFTSNAIDDPTDKMGCYCTPVIHNMVEHPITEGVSQIVFYKPCALRVSGDAVAIARGDDDSRTVGAEKITGEDIVVVAVAEYEYGRVVVAGSHTAFDDSFIDQSDNYTFSANVFNWVSEQVVPKDTSWITLVGILVIAVVLVLIIVLKRRL